MNLKELPNNNGFTCLSMSGRLDIAGVEAIELKYTSAIGASTTSVIVDLSDVDFIASLGMRMLLSSAKSLKSRGLGIALCCPQPMVLEALQTAGFGSLFPIAGAMEEAEQALES